MKARYDGAKDVVIDLRPQGAARAAGVHRNPFERASTQPQTGAMLRSSARATLDGGDRVTYFTRLFSVPVVIFPETEKRVRVTVQPTTDSVSFAQATRGRGLTPNGSRAPATPAPPSGAASPARTAWTRSTGGAGRGPCSCNLKVIGLAQSLQELMAQQLDWKSL
jgi:hypothetical protein